MPIDLSERERLVANLGDKGAMLLRNHGTLAVGKNVGECFVRLYFLERACQAQVMALAAGDSKFKERTAKKMFELCGNGRTIVLVTHGLSTVKLMATNALWLHQGKVVEHGDPDDVVASYMRYCRIEALEGVDDE